MNDWCSRTSFDDVLDCEGVADAGEFMAVHVNTPDPAYCRDGIGDIDGYNHLFHLATGNHGVYVWDNDSFRQFIDAVKLRCDAKFEFECEQAGEARTISFKNNLFTYQVSDYDRLAADMTVGFTDLLVERLEKCYQTIERDIGKRDARRFQQKESKTILSSKYANKHSVGLLGVGLADIRVISSK